MMNPMLIAFLVLAVAFLVVFVVAGTRRQQAPIGHGGIAIGILPRSTLGWSSVGLAVAFVLALVAVTGPLLGDDLLDAESNQALAVVLKIALIGISGASFVAGLVSFIKRKDMSVLVFVSMLITLWLGIITMGAHLFME